MALRQRPLLAPLAAAALLCAVAVAFEPRNGAFVAPLEMRQPKPQRPNSRHGFPSVVRLVEPLPDPLADRAPRLAAVLRRVGLRPAVTWTSRYHNVQLYGGMVAVGEYYAKVKIGGQTLRVQIDTGSATLAVPVKECKDCKRGDMRYSLKDSDSGIAKAIGCEDEGCSANSCSPYSCGKCSGRQACCAKSDHDKCGFHLNFGDGSGAKGILIRDTLQWGDLKFPVTFGGIRSDSPDFERSQVDGILGMAYPSLACNPSCIVPTFEAMCKKYTMKNMFTICITYDSGKIVLGDYDPLLSTKAVTWVPMHMSTPPSFYSFPVKGNLLVDGVDLPLPSYSKAIVDSGTTLIVFSHATFDKFKKYLQKKFCGVPGLCGEQSWFRPAHCTKISDVDRNKMPTLTFMVEGFNITLGPSEYLINYASKGPEYWCVGIMALNSMSGGVDVIFGNTVMKKYVTIYDRDNKRVGFAESDTHCGFDVHNSGNDTATLPLPPAPVPNQQPKGNGHATQAPTASGPPDGQGGAQKGGGNTAGPGSFSGICTEAASCSMCSKVTERKCRWNGSAGRCEDGDPTPLMCTWDGLARNPVYVVGGALAAVVALVAITAAVVHSYRKRQGNSVSSGEDIGEVERPLAENEVDTRGAFAIGEDEEDGRPS